MATLRECVTIAVEAVMLPEALEAGGQNQRPDLDPLVISIEAKLQRAGKGKRLVIENGAGDEVNAGLAAMISEAFSIRNQLLSGSDDSVEAMTERLGIGKSRLTSLVRLGDLDSNQD